MGDLNMLKIMAILLLGLFSVNFSSAQQVVSDKGFPMVTWVSKDPNDVMKIENGASTPILVVITVNRDSQGNLAGINIRNCAKTTHVDPGSSVICYNTDGNLPVSFNSDSGLKGAAGTYQIKQQ